MANWRRKALALFPELRYDVQLPEFTIYSLFFELLPMSRRGGPGIFEPFVADLRDR